MDSENITSEKIHVVFTPYDMADSYNRHVGAAITSLLENCSAPVVIHIMYDAALNRNQNDYEVNKSSYLSFMEHYNVEIKLHDVQIPEWYHSLRGAKILSVGTYYRLFIPDILSNVSKVIYLDGDVIITMDIKEFWDIDISNVPIAARIDPMFQEEMETKPKNIIPIYEKLNFTKEDLSRYFNAGILYLNLDYIRSIMNLPEMGGKYLSENLTTPRADQDALNFLFNSTAYNLSEKYNTFAYEVNGNVPKACIHFVTRKPWKSYRDPIDTEYWKYLSLSPWCPDRDSFIKYITAVGNSSVDALSTTMSQVPLTTLTKIFISHCIQRIKRYLLFIGKIN